MKIHYYPLINKIITGLNLRDKLNVPQHLAEEASFVKPFVTIAREPGSGGAPIARLVAEKLGFTLIDDQLVEEIAKSTKKRKEIIQAVDERSRTAINDVLHSLINNEYVDDLKYVTELVRLILVYAHQGHTVILGRGANFITPFAHGLHARVTAPYDVRVQRAIHYEGISEKKAKQVIAEVEKQREEFVKQYLSKEATKSNAYDLTINTAYLDMDAAANVIVEAFYQKFKRASRYRAILK
jgi:cytidylate kinase